MWRDHQQVSKSDSGRNQIISDYIQSLCSTDLTLAACSLRAILDHSLSDGFEGEKRGFERVSDPGSQKKTDVLNGFLPIFSLNTCLSSRSTIPSPKVKTGTMREYEACIIELSI